MHVTELTSHLETQLQADSLASGESTEIKTKGLPFLLALNPREGGESDSGGSQCWMWAEPVLFTVGQVDTGQWGSSLTLSSLTKTASRRQAGSAPSFPW